TLFWRAWLASDIAPALIGLYTAPGAIERSRTIIVAQPKLWRFDLLVLDPALPPGAKPRTMSALLAGRVVRHGLLRRAGPRPVGVGGGGGEGEGVAFAVEAVANPDQPWSFVVAREPQQERLSTPSPALAVDDGAGQISTAGVLVEDLTNPARKGVTAALHGVE